MAKELRNLNMVQQTVKNQEMLIELYYRDLDLVRKGHKSVLLESIGLKNVASTASMKIDELEAFWLDAKLLEPQFFLKDATKMTLRCAPFPAFEYAFEFVKATYNRAAKYIMYDMDLVPEVFDKEAETLAAKNYALHIAEFPDRQVDEYFESAICFQRIAMEYLWLFSKRVKYLLEKGYDWEVIETMMRTELSKERFKEIAERSREFMYKHYHSPSERINVETKIDLSFLRMIKDKTY